MWRSGCALRPDRRHACKETDNLVLDLAEPEGIGPAFVFAIDCNTQSRVMAKDDPRLPLLEKASKRTFTARRFSARGGPGRRGKAINRPKRALNDSSLSSAPFMPTSASQTRTHSPLTSPRKRVDPALKRHPLAPRSSEPSFATARAGGGPRCLRFELLALGQVIAEM